MTYVGEPYRHANGAVDTPLYIMEVVCEHAQHPHLTAPPAQVTRVVRVLTDMSGTVKVDGQPVGMEPYERWVQGVPDGDQPPAVQSFFGVLREVLRDVDPEERSAILRDPARRERLLASRASGRTMGYQTRWRFECPTCHETVPIGDDKLVPLLDAMRARGDTRVTIAIVRAFASKMR